MFAVHPSAEDFERFLRGSSRSVDPMRNAQVMRHLLGKCAICQDRLEAIGWSAGRLARLLQPASEAELTETPAKQPYDYSKAFTASAEAVSAFLIPEPEAAIPAPVLWAEFEALPAEERRQRVGVQGPFTSPAFVRLLIDHSHSLRYRHADQMLHFAGLARTAAETCSEEQAGGERRLADLRTRAWGAYGNALRVNSLPTDAGQAIATAQAYRSRGTGDPALRAWLLERITPLLVFQGRHAEAIEMCDEAGQIYQDLGETHLYSIALTQKAIASIYAGETERAVRTLNQAIPLIDHEEDPHLLLAACHNLIRCYIDLDRPEQALSIYSETRELYQEFNDPLIQLRAAWQEGQLLRDLGHLRAAEAALLRARKGYLERSLAYEVALVSLDLATVYVRLGLVDDLKRTVASTVPIFRALRVGLESLAALLQLQQLADQEQQALDVIRALSTRIQPLARPRLSE
jgi:tetratricopeptide (TPR) repeat protein